MKLFGKGGKMNIVDVVVILILIAALVFVGMKVLGNDGAVAEGGSNTDYAAPLSTPNVRFTVVCEGVPRELAESAMNSVLSEVPLNLHDDDLPDGDPVPTVKANRIFNGNKFADAEITDCRIEPTVNPDEDKVDLYFTIVGCGLLRDGVYNVGTQEIRIGKGIWVKTLDVELSGTVYTLEKLS